MLDNKDYCDYDTCVALKELGYKVPTSAYYMPNNNQLIFVISQFRGEAAMDCFYSHNSLPKECMGSDYIDAPTMWEAQKWLREERKIIIVISPYSYDYVNETRTWTYEVWLGDNLETDAHKFDSYEEALLEGVRAAINLLKEEK